ncbi:MAG: DUF805 domain-containing protein [Microbacterium enclense]
MTNSLSEPALDQPYYGAPFGVAVRRFFKKYATFSGRASRSEYWWWVLASAIVTFVLQLLIALTGAARMRPDGTFEVEGGFGVIFVVLLAIWGLVTIVPYIALLVRRLHDTNRSGFWVFIYFVPLAGPIILFVFTLLSSKPEGARFDR